MARGHIPVAAVLDVHRRPDRTGPPPASPLRSTDDHVGNGVPLLVALADDHQIDQRRRRSGPLSEWPIGRVESEPERGGEIAAPHPDRRERGTIPEESGQRSVAVDDDDIVRHRARLAPRLTLTDRHPAIRCRLVDGASVEHHHLTGVDHRDRTARCDNTAEQRIGGFLGCSTGGFVGRRSPFGAGGRSVACGADKVAARELLGLDDLGESLPRRPGEGDGQERRVRSSGGAGNPSTPRRLRAGR